MIMLQDFSIRGKYIDPKFQFDFDSDIIVSDWQDHRMSARSDAEIKKI